MTDKERLLYDKLTHLELVLESLLDLLIKRDIIDYKDLQRTVDKNVDIISKKLDEKASEHPSAPVEDEHEELDDKTIPFHFWGPGGDA